MAQATTLPFSAFKVMLETETPGTFVAPCGLTERGITFTKETNDTTTIDCDDEDAANWVERDVVSFSSTISGEGLMARQSYKTWREAYLSKEPVNVRAEVAGTLAEGGGYWSGKYIITNLEQTATKGERVTVSIEGQSTGPVVWTDAAA